MAKQKSTKDEIGLSLKEIEREHYHKLNIAFSLMSIIPFLVFLYLLVTKLFSIEIVIGNVGGILILSLVVSLLGYWVGHAEIRNLLSKIIKYTEKTRLAYNQLKETQESLIHAERFKAVGQLASGIAHEVKNPLGIILQDINYLEENISPGKDVTNVLNMMKKNIEKADNIVCVLLDFSKASKMDIEPHDINSVIDNSLLLIKHKVEAENITFIKEFKGRLPKVLADGVKIEQVFVNIFLNAIQAMPDGGKLSIRAYQKQMEGTGYRIGRRKSNGDFFEPGETVVAIEIEDTGAGIPKEDLKKVFDPFFTTKGPKGGTGLGLSVIRNIIEMHRGLISIKSKEGKGTRVTVILKTVGGQHDK